MNRKIKAYENGMRAEKIAAIMLRLKGYRILATRYKTPVGEIDLIAKRGRTLAIIEVKTRGDALSAMEAVTPKNQGRVTQAAQYYLSRNPALAACDIRFDVIVMGWPFFWRHLDNAWQGRT